MKDDKQIPLTKPFFNEEEITLVRECLDSGWVTQGPMSDRFEEEFLKVHNSSYAIATSSCTSALHLALLALGIKKGDEVLVPSFTWITSANCVEYVGATVKFIDVETATFNIDPVEMEKQITEKTKAIVVVHLFGCAARMDEILEIAEKYQLYVIEDCACAIGTTYKGVPVGVLGDVGCFSFHPRKAITTGEGGMCSTSQKELADKIRQLRNHGVRLNSQDPEYGHAYYMGVYDELGYNLRLSDIQAAVGIAQFGKLENLLKGRKECADYYIERLKDVKSLRLPIVSEDFGHTYQSFVILLDTDRGKRNYIIDKLGESRIQSRPGTLAVHNTEYYRKKYRLKEEDFPNSARSEALSITLPLYSGMPREEQDRVIEILLKYN